jgi:hypothetical protein
MALYRDDKLFYIKLFMINSLTKKKQNWKAIFFQQGRNFNWEFIFKQELFTKFENSTIKNCFRSSTKKVTPTSHYKVTPTSHYLNAMYISLQACPYTCPIKKIKNKKKLNVMYISSQAYPYTCPVKKNKNPAHLTDLMKT